MLATKEGLRYYNEAILIKRIESTHLLLNSLNIEILLNKPREIADKIFVGDEAGTADHCFQSFEIAKGFLSFLKDKEQNLFETEKDENEFLTGVLLHDVGKNGIAQEILKKKGKLSDEEFLEVKKHPEIGIKIVAGIDWITRPIKNIISEHHERIDGNGYPSNLDLNSISLEGKIIAIVDVFEALTGNRAYNKYRDYEDTMDFMNTESFNNKFDQEILNLFFDFIKTQPQYQLEHGQILLNP